MENVLENVWNGIINAKYEAYYQPQYNNVTREITGFEALARLNDPDGVVSPGNFISVMEKNGMIVELDSYIFESACKFLKKCVDKKALIVPVAINLSRHDFYEDDFIDKLEEIRKKYDVNVKLLRIEISGALAADNKEKAIEIITKFHRYGYSVTLDNFGGDDPSLSFIKDLRYDIIKLDMMQIGKDIETNGGKVISSILKKAKSLNVTVIAQTIETLEQAEFFESKDCEFSQGYYYARPMAEKNAFSLVKPTKESSLNPQERTYKKKFENVLEQLSIYYWDYNCANKEIYPCFRSMRDFGLDETVTNFPDSLIESGFVPNEYEKTCRNMYKLLADGTKHVEAVVAMGEDRASYYVRCDCDFDENNKPIGAHCTAIKVVEVAGEEEHKKTDSFFGKFAKKK